MNSLNQSKQNDYLLNSETLTRIKIMDVKIATHYFPCGQLQRKTHWRDGKRHGVSDIYYQNGSKKQAEFWIDGKPHGVWKHYSESGEMEQRFVFFHGVEQFGEAFEYLGQLDEALKKLRDDLIPIVLNRTKAQREFSSLLGSINEVIDKKANELLECSGLWMSWEEVEERDTAEIY